MARQLCTRLRSLGLRELGDFNVSDFLTSNKAIQSASSIRKLENFAISADLEQLITIATRITESAKSAIDLLFVNDRHRVVTCGTIISTISDHLVVFCVVKSGVTKAPPRKLEYRFYKNYDKTNFLDDLRAVDWEHIIDSSDNIDEAVSNWSTTFNTIADYHAPLKSMRVKGLQVPWMNTELRQTMRDRDYCYRKAVKTKRADDWKKYKELKSFVKCEMKRHKAEYYKELISQNKTKPDKLINVSMK